MWLFQEGGVSILTAALESCLEVQWKDQYECVLNPAVPPISLEASQRVIEILKILFNITHSTHRQEPSEVSDTKCRIKVQSQHLHKGRSNQNISSFSRYCLPAVLHT